MGEEKGSLKRKTSLMWLLVIFLFIYPFMIKLLSIYLRQVSLHDSFLVLSKTWSELVSVYFNYDTLLKIPDVFESYKGYYGTVFSILAAVFIFFLEQNNNRRKETQERIQREKEYVKKQAEAENKRLEMEANNFRPLYLVDINDDDRNQITVVFPAKEALIRNVLVQEIADNGAKVLKQKKLYSSKKHKDILTEKHKNDNLFIVADTLKRERVFTLIYSNVVMSYIDKSGESIWKLDEKNIIIQDPLHPGMSQFLKQLLKETVNGFSFYGEGNRNNILANSDTISIAKSYTIASLFEQTISYMRYTSLKKEPNKIVDLLKLYSNFFKQEQISIYQKNPEDMWIEHHYLNGNIKTTQNEKLKETIIDNDEEINDEYFAKYLERVIEQLQQEKNTYSIIEYGLRNLEVLADRLEFPEGYKNVEREKMVVHQLKQKVLSIINRSA